MRSATDIIVLSSSSPDQIPCRTPSQAEYNSEKISRLSLQCSSPDSLVSPSELFKPQSPLRSRFFDTGITSRRKKKENKVSTATAGIGDSTILGTKDENAGDKSRDGNRKFARKTDTDPGDVGTAATNKKQKPKRTAKAKSTRTTKAIKCGESGNMTLTGRVAKARDAPNKEACKKADVPLPSPTSLFGPTTIKEQAEWEDEGLQSEEAVKRRLDWTPPKDTTPNTEIIELDSEHETMEGNSKPVSRHGFGNMLSGYNFSGNTSSSRDVTQIVEDGGPTKRRRIELVDSRVFPIFKNSSLDANDKTSAEKDQSSVEKKSKRQRKKMTTITAHATARYISKDTSNSNTPDRDLSVTGDLTIEDTINSRLGRRTKPKSKTNAPEYTILSPEAAAKSLQDQDLVFGTCSQLERDDSPTTLREMQMAIRASESCVSTESNFLSNRSTGTKLSSFPAVSRFAGARNLWCVAARDSDGSMVQAEVVDLVDSPEPSRIISENNHDSGHYGEVEAAEQDSWLEIDDLPEAPSTLFDKTDNTKELPLPKDAYVATGNVSTAVYQPAVTVEQQKETSNQVAESHAPMPQYSGFTDAELSKAIATYGFKAIKSRTKMINLLQKCWESKYGKSKNSVDDITEPQGNPKHTTRISQADLPLTEKKGTANVSRSKPNKKSQPKSSSNLVTRTKSTPTPSSQTTTAKRKYTKQKKSNPPPPPTTTTTTFQDIEEIEDSEDELIPSPSRLQNRYNNTRTTRNNPKNGTNPLPISTIPSSPSRKSQPHSSSSSSSHLPSNSRRDSLPDLAGQIASAVHAQPRSSKRPIWHEKILMYDPIVLEDFATWLNTEGLGLVGEDREVSAGFVRGWCEARGICCCWKKMEGS